MESNKSFTMVCPNTYHNRVNVIKAIRCLTGLGLKEAKDASETRGEQTFSFNIDLMPSGNQESYIEEQFRILRSEGVQVGPPVQMVLEDLRELATQALKMHEDELANEILQLVLAEKLRRKPL